MRINALLAATLILIVCGCGRGQPASDVSEESAIRGTAVIPCDIQLIDMMNAIGKSYASDYPAANVTFEPMTTREAIRNLFGGLTKGIIIPREYLPDEDSIIKSNGYAFPRTLLAKDALVFYASKSFPYDTMSSAHIVAWFKGEIGESEMKRMYPKLAGRAPTFVSPFPGSVHANILRIAGGQIAQGRLTALENKDSILRRMATGQNALVGVGYLSQFAKDTTVKMLRLSYFDKSGTYQLPKVVHAANLIQGKYPFPVPIYFILKDTPSQHSLTSGVMQYLARDARAQRGFFDAGIEPAFAQIELILPD